MIESQLFVTYILVLCLFFDVMLVRKFLSEIPEKASESFLSEVVFPKLFRPKFSISIYLQNQRQNFSTTITYVGLTSNVKPAHVFIRNRFFIFSTLYSMTYLVVSLRSC